LIGLGLRLRWLGTEWLTWGDLLAIVRQSPRGSALSRAINGESDIWGLPEHLLAGIADLIALGNWQRGGDEKAKRPDMIPRPGLDARRQKLGMVGGDVIGGDGKGMTQEELDRRLGWDMQPT
jgi:hypothetical protein